MFTLLGDETFPALLGVVVARLLSSALQTAATIETLRFQHMLCGFSLGSVGPPRR